MAGSIERFVTGLDRSLARMESEGDPDPVTRRKISTIVDKCGWKKRSEQRMQRINEELSHAGIFSDQDLTDLGLGMDSWVRFSRTPPVVLNRVFRQERAIGYHISKYTEAIDQALPIYAPVRAVHGGHRAEQRYKIGTRVVVPDLVLRSATGEWIVAEIERLDPDHGSVGQLMAYLDAVSAKVTGEVVGLLITAKPRHLATTRIVREALKDLSRRYTVHWLWYDVDVALETAF